MSRPVSKAGAGAPAIDERRIKMAAKLYECRDAAKTLLGGQYAPKMRQWGEVISGKARESGCSELAAAVALAKDADGFCAMVIMAAVVEMTEFGEGVTLGT